LLPNSADLPTSGTAQSNLQTYKIYKSHFTAWGFFNTVPCPSHHPVEGKYPTCSTLQYCSVIYQHTQKTKTIWDISHLSARGSTDDFSFFPLNWSLYTIFDVQASKANPDRCSPFSWKSLFHFSKTCTTGYATPEETFITVLTWQQ